MLPLMNFQVALLRESLATLRTFEDIFNTEVISSNVKVKSESSGVAVFTSLKMASEFLFVLLNGCLWHLLI
jgi:hypothetical protein